VGAAQSGAASPARAASGSRATSVVAARTLGPAAPTSKAVEDPPADAPPAPSASAGGGDVALQAMMNQAVGPTSTLAPVGSASAPSNDTSDVAPHGLPVRPAQGAVEAALGATLPDARACLDLDAPVSRATVTFRSDGHAQSVSISGWAKGKAVEGCIRTALMKTHVGPFAEETFSVPVTIRSN
jgi:hypothetical protein